MASGAEVKRVEDTLERIGVAYGAERMNVFVITSSIVITLERSDGTLLTHTRRITKSGTDCLALERINALSRECCREPLPLDLFEQRLRECVPPKKQWQMYLGSVLAAGSFAVFFGGGWKDALISGIFAVAISLLQDYVELICINTMVFNVIASFLTGIGIRLICRLVPGLDMDMIMIGDIMLLIPGIPITNAVRDVLTGDTISGIMRFIEAMLWAGCLALGFLSAFWIVGKVW